MLDSILVYLNGTRAAPGLNKASVFLAERHGARVRAMTIADTRAAESVVESCESAVFAAVERQHLSLMGTMQAGVQAELATALLVAGISFDIRRESGDPFDLLPREAGYHDLVVTVCETSDHSSHSDVDDAGDPRELIDLAMAGARPMLIVRGPDIAPSRALLVYDGTPAAGRAIRNFLRRDLWPGLETRLLAVGSTDDESRMLQQEMADACREFSVRPQLSHRSGSLRRILISSVRHWQADLVVLCAGRGSAVLRRFFGDAPLDVLRKTACALYLAE